jgi:hypothetical protein
MRRRSFVHLVVSCIVFLPVAATAANVGIQVSGPLVHDNLAVYFVHGSAAQNAVPMSLEEAHIPVPPAVTPAGTVILNPTANTACMMGCTSSQLACQTTCAQASPSQ